MFIAWKITSRTLSRAALHVASPVYARRVGVSPSSFRLTHRSHSRARSTKTTRDLEKEDPDDELLTGKAYFLANKIGHTTAKKASQILKAILADDRASEKAIKVCLIDMWKWTRSVESDRHGGDLKKAASGYDVGKPVLRWLSQDDARWFRALEDDEFQKIACTFFVAEGMDDLIVKWILVGNRPYASRVSLRGKHMTEREVRMEHIRRQHSWRGHLLQHLVHAHLLFGVHNKSADAAMDCLFNFIDNPPGSDPNTLIYMNWKSTSLLPSIFGLMRMLGDTLDFSNTSVTKWERAEQLMKQDLGARGPGAVSSLEWGLAKLRLCHPANPDPQPMLDMLKSRFGSTELSSKTLPEHTRPFVSRMLVQLISKLHDQGRKEDVQWSSDFRAIVLPKSTTWSMGRRPSAWPGASNPNRTSLL